MARRDKNIVIITGPGFEDPEVIYPYFRLKEEGFKVQVATSSDEEVKGKHGYPFAPTIKLANLKEKDFDAVVIPGGHEAPDRVRQRPEVLKFIRLMNNKNKLISSTCHGPWVLISSGIMKGKQATCYPGMKDDLINCGAKYKNLDVVVDGNIITSDHPRNLGSWMKKTIAALNK